MSNDKADGWVITNGDSWAFYRSLRIAEEDFKEGGDVTGYRIRPVRLQFLDENLSKCCKAEAIPGQYNNPFDSTKIWICKQCGGECKLLPAAPKEQV